MEQQGKYVFVPEMSETRDGKVVSELWLNLASGTIPGAVKNAFRCSDINEWRYVLQAVWACKVKQHHTCYERTDVLVKGGRHLQKSG